MEIYRNEIANVDLIVPVFAIPGSFEVKAVAGTTVLHTFSTVTAIANGYRVTLPFSLVVNDSEFVIVWKFNYLEGSATKTYEQRQAIEVVTPYVSRAELAVLLDDVSEDERMEAEAIVRRIIDVYTGQSFGRFSGTIDVKGNDSTQLALPLPLLTLTEMSDDRLDYDINSFVIRGNGWFLGQTPGAWWTIKSAPPEEILDQFSSGVIYAPGAISKKDFAYTSYYTVKGDWGYDSVPVPVVQAAKMLISDYACQDSSYRDRYLESMKAADWRIQFTQGAYDGTGNLKADQLLEPYKLSNLAVI
jgi:hypothetical protein